jgi:hypothetical protein
MIRLEENAMKKVIILLILGLLTACATRYAPGEMELRTLDKGNFSGIETTRRVVARDAGEWARIWSEHQAGRQPAEPLPPVNFQEEMVIAVTMGVQPTGGYAIEVSGVELRVDALRVTVERTVPPAGAMLIQALTAPYHFAAVPRTDLPVRFAETTTRGE